MGSGQSQLPADRHVVVVGGGYGGVHLAMRLLKAQARFTLIDAKDAFCHCVAAVRAIVEPDVAPKMFIDYKTTFGDRFRQGRVVSISPADKELVMDDESRVSYDVLVLATGCTGPFPGKLWDAGSDEGTKAYREYAEKVKACKRVAIVGGGPVGVEIAAELKTDYSDKEVVLIHSQEQLLRSGLSDSFHKKLRGILVDRMGIQIKTGVKLANIDDLDLTSDGPFTLSLSDGSTVEADLVIRCTGNKVNTQAFESGLGDSLAEHGALRVSEQLLVEGQEAVFALGDCNNVAEMKLAVTAAYQADHVFANIRALLLGQPLAPYSPDGQPFKIVISLGRNSGIGELKVGFILPEFLVKRLKSRDMFVSKFWGEMNQKPPR